MHSLFTWLNDKQGGWNILPESVHWQRDIEWYHQDSMEGPTAIIILLIMSSENSASLVFRGQDLGKR